MPQWGAFNVLDAPIQGVHNLCVSICSIPLPLSVLHYVVLHYVVPHHIHRILLPCLFYLPTCSLVFFSWHTQHLFSTHVQTIRVLPLLLSDMRNFFNALKNCLRTVGSRVGTRTTQEGFRWPKCTVTRQYLCPDPQKGRLYYFIYALGSQCLMVVGQKKYYLLTAPTVISLLLNNIVLDI